MTQAPLTTDELLRDLHSRFLWVERAILGDPSIGHVGIVQRMEVIEAAHLKLDERRVEGERRLNDRISGVVNEWTRAKYTFIGAAVGIGVASGFGGTWLFSALVGG